MTTNASTLIAKGQELLEKANNLMSKLEETADKHEIANELIQVAISLNNIGLALAVLDHFEYEGAIELAELFRTTGRMAASKANKIVLNTETLPPPVTSYRRKFN